MQPNAAPNPAKELLPNLVIAGVHKAGTTSLYSYLGKHPDICPSHTKEINFFGPLAFGRETASLDSYAQHFTHWRDEPYRLEASPSYLYGRDTIARALKSTLPEPAVVLILRDPVDRLRSFFSRAVSKGTLPEGMGLSQYLEVAREKRDSAEHTVYSRGIREGQYIDYIEPWRSRFGDRLKIVFFEDLKADAGRLTSSIVEWLDLDASTYRPEDFTIENKTVHYKNRRIHEFVRTVYIRSETFWRRHDGLKKWLRGRYNRLNASRDDGRQQLDQEAVDWLHDHYHPYNDRLRQWLLQSNVTGLPDWLSPA